MGKKNLKASVREQVDWLINDYCVRHAVPQNAIILNCEDFEELQKEFESSLQFSEDYNTIIGNMPRVSMYKGVKIYCETNVSFL